MSNIELHQPHDAFFRRSLSHIAVAKDFLKAHISSALAERINWKTLRSTDKSFVKEVLKQLHSDVVYQCQLDGKSAYIYTLIEHQSTPDPQLPFRILQYNVALMEAHLAQDNTHLPAIINLCLYSGKKTPYPYSTDLYDIFEDPNLAREVMFKPLQLIDLNCYSEETLSQHGQADLLEILLKHSQERAFIHWIKQHPELIRRLLERIYGESGIIYILGVDQHDSAEKIIDTILAIAPNKKETIMTAAQQLHQQGIQQGMQQGMQKGMEEGMQTRTLDIAKNMLYKLHLGTDLVHQATGLSHEEIAQLKADMIKDTSKATKNLP